VRDSGSRRATDGVSTLSGRGEREVRMFIVIQHDLDSGLGISVDEMKLNFGQPWFANCPPEHGEDLDSWWLKAIKNFEYNYPGKELEAALITPKLETPEFVSFLKGKGLKVFVGGLVSEVPATEVTK